MEKEKIISLLLRLSLAFAFIYAAVSIFISPENWIGFVPAFIGNIERAYALQAHAVFDLIIGLWLLTNKETFYASVLAALNLFAIVIVNLSQLDIVFRDISLFIVAIALAFLSFNRSR